MIINIDKLPAIFLSKIDNSVSHKLNIYDNNTETTKSVKLLGIEIDHPLRFNRHISTLCPEAEMQLNILSRLRRFMGNAKKNAIMNSFIYANFNYCLVHAHLPEKLKTFKNVALSLNMMTTKVIMKL